MRMVGMSPFAAASYVNDRLMPSKEAASVQL